MKNKKVCIAISLFLALGLTACSQTSSSNPSSLSGHETASAASAVLNDKTSATEGSSAEGSSAEGIVPRVTGEEYYRNTETDIAYEAEADSFRMAEGAKSLTTDAAALEGEAYGEAVTNDAPTVPAEEPAAEPIAPDISGSEGDIIEISEPVPSIDPQPGLLTAGEWNDNNNWGFFTNLVNTGTIQFPCYGLEPRYRTKVELKNAEGQAVVNANVSLMDNGKVLWTAVTDKNGVAYLFAENSRQGTDIHVACGDTTKDYSLATDQVEPVVSDSDPQQQGTATFQDASIGLVFDESGKTYPKTDIMFIVDATGSMSDEMLFLQTEFTAISEEVGDDNTRFSVNFYRDKGDEYITKCYDFTSDVKGLQEKLNGESAYGGGDTPEAVAEILDETINKSNWDEESVKLAFLIYDAPPHNGTEQSLQQSIKNAAEKGIHLIPVVSSGSERDTELFGRAAAIMTNGTYVFLTDDSGIGGSHMEPIIGSYDVEKLYDIVVRIIKDYKQ